MSFYIVEREEQLNELPIYDKCFIYVIPLNSFYHPKLTSPCLVYYRSLEGKGHIICVDHSESFNINFDNILAFIKKHKQIYTIDAKHNKYFLKDVTLNDVNFNLPKALNITTYNTTTHDYFYNEEYKFNPEIEKIIPITKQFEKFDNIFNYIKDKCVKNTPYNKDCINVLYNIENNGIQIDPSVFFKNFEPTYESASIKNNVIYTQYNLYNNTTRPTNAFNGINYSALTKNSRASFIANNDFLIELDYEGYHPRLIANNIKYNFDKSKPVYEQLSELYFGEVSDESIRLSKEYTFKQLYGGIEEKYLEIEYFKKINEWVEEEWKEYKSCSNIFLYGGKEITDSTLSKNQLFNYLIQSLETYTNINTLNKILPLLENKKTKLIMYNYDAFIFDVSKDDKEIIKNIYNIISEQFPVKISYGDNYKDMERIHNF